ncbi:MAG: signal peptidase I [Prevotellaceae bacterium]|nr:signal peptidase I [Prevotellaceae bacterium]MDD6008710.1 signal peptidase I [Prevotellaceae bacterium]MDD6112617.1 signal peptidase I [Prevotellaceae bacterium]MDD6781025.1 signal peptidase I [Prevotellaceae bacterium]
MEDLSKKKLNMKVQWAKFAVVLTLYIAFLIWVKSWLGIIVIPFIYDVYITKKIKWQWWKDAEKPVKFVMSWVDALVFALVAVYFINLFFFQNYVIPSSSLEKSLLTGDYLFVSKVSYGPRIPETPLTMPLTQHTLPVVDCKSYIEWPHWEYRRVKGLGKVELNDIVVFNYPAGDTLCSAPQYQSYDYYGMCYSIGYQIYTQRPNPDSLSAMDRIKYFNTIYEAGREELRRNQQEYGEITTRPTDRRENYVKRCVGLPGQTLQIKNRIVYLDGKANKEPENVQYSYYVKLRQRLPEEMLKELGISNEDLLSLNSAGYMPLTKRAVAMLSQRKDLVESIEINTDASDLEIYPLNGNKHWTRDNYGPIWIPAKGKSINLTLDNIAVYERPIRVYEGNDLKITDGKIFINGKEAKSYTFKMDYYWMMGDNRHNSADSRYWGFVPEDHIVGKPIFIWWSSDPDRNGFSGIRWNRLFRFVDNIK